MPNDPSLLLTYVSPGSLRLNPRNVRTHSPRQVRQLAEIIRTIGFVTPVVVDENDLVLAGHGRLQAAHKLGLASVPVVRASSLTEAQKRAFVLADNKMAEKAGWDREALAIELSELAALLPPFDLDLTSTGFELAEIDTILADRGAPKIEVAETLPMLSAKVVTRRGDLWRLGSHRLFCGDARSSDDLARLMAGELAAAMFADPPYNVRVAGHVQGRGRTRHAEFACASGEMSEGEFQAFLKGVLAQAIRVSRPGALHYVCMDWRHIADLIGVANPLYDEMINLCVWAKTNAGQGSFYRSQHELIGLWRVAGAPHRNTVELGRHGRNRSNLWTFPGVNSFGGGRAEALRIHPTVKPVSMIVEALRDCTALGESVLDIFLGSGTTLLAAEKIGRRAFGMELEPRYVDVAVNRWQATTRLDAVLEGDGRCFADVASAREAEAGVGGFDSNSANSTAGTGR